VHLLVPNHGPEFWARLERAMPDYLARKEWLAEQGAGIN
jgi:predicted metal-dependent hydrolase